MGLKEYEQKYGTTQQNELLFKCFEGDSSDCVKGVKGITRNTLIKYFPAIAKERYTYKRLVEEATEAKKTKKLKTYDSIISAEEILYRNAQLMNLKKPFVNQQAVNTVEAVKHGVLGDDRDIKRSIEKFVNYGLLTFIGDYENADNFLSPFYSLMIKEKNYAKAMNNMIL
jgi:5'-3' exonuclease